MLYTVSFIFMLVLISRSYGIYCKSCFTYCSFCPDNNMFGISNICITLMKHSKLWDYDLFNTSRHLDIAITPSINCKGLNLCFIFVIYICALFLPVFLSLYSRFVNGIRIQPPNITRIFLVYCQCPLINCKNKFKNLWIFSPS